MRTWRAVLGVLAAVLAAAGGCEASGDTLSPSERDEACVLLRRTRAVESLLPLSERTLMDVLKSSAFVDDRLAAIYLEPDESATLDDVAGELGAMDGIEVVQIIDQTEALEIFRETFADSPKALGSIEAEDLPPSLVIGADDDAALDQVLVTFEGDERVYWVFNARGEIQDGLDAIVATFSEEVRQLGDLSESELRESIVHLSHVANRDGALTVDEVAPVRKSARVVHEFEANSCGGAAEDEGLPSTTARAGFWE